MKSLALWILRTYKRWLSPIFPPSCRYVPTCSEFAMEAVEKFGVLRGGFMTMGRVLRCHPFVKGGYDPVRDTNVSRRTPDSREAAQEYSPRRKPWVRVEIDRAPKGAAEQFRGKVATTGAEVSEPNNSLFAAATRCATQNLRTTND